MKTPYSKPNAKFSDDVHRHSGEFYRGVFPEGIISGENLVGTKADLEDGIDYAATTPLGRFTIQERWRKLRFSHFRDVTITRWNITSDRPSEFYKTRADLMFYGYANAEHKLYSAVAVDMQLVLEGVRSGDLPYTEKSKPDDSQDFICVCWDDLHRFGAVRHSLRGGFEA
jgi:hypothetical protein